MARQVQPLIVLVGVSDECASRIQLVSEDALVVVADPPAALDVRRAALVAQPGDAEWSVGDLEIDPPRRQARWKGDALDLAPGELRLLSVLASDTERVWATHELLGEVWGRSVGSTEEALRSCVKRLRRRVAGTGLRIDAVRGFGFRLGGIDDP